MASSTKSLITAEDLYRMPDDGLVHELLRGRLVSEPLPSGRHGRIASNIDFALQTWVRTTGAGVVYICDTGFVLERDPDTVRGPDVAYLSARRYRRIEDESRFVSGPPDLAVEVLSPSNRRTDMHAKVADYLGAGTSMVWVVDPARESIVVHTPTKSVQLGIGDKLTAPDLLPGFCVAVSEVFRSPALRSGAD